MPPCREAVRAAGLTLQDIEDVLLVGGMTRSPVIQSQVAAVFQRKPSLRVNPDEVVATGAALVGASLNGELPEARLVDVAPRTLGLATAGDSYAILIQASTALPAVAKQRFVTTANDQTHFDIVVLQGENPVASHNRKLSRIELGPVPAAPAGQVFADVTFTLDAHGRLHVQAVESATGQTIDGPVRAFSGLGSSQVERLAAEHRARQDTARADTAGDGDSGDDDSGMGSFSIEFK